MVELGPAAAWAAFAVGAVVVVVFVALPFVAGVRWP